MIQGYAMLLIDHVAPVFGVLTDPRIPGGWVAFGEILAAVRSGRSLVIASGALGLAPRLGGRTGRARHLRWLNVCAPVPKEHRTCT
jgi:hypothetical protein